MHWPPKPDVVSRTFIALTRGDFNGDGRRDDWRKPCIPACGGAVEPLGGCSNGHMHIPVEDEFEHEFDGPDGTDDTANIGRKDEVAADPVAPSDARPDIELLGVPRWVSLEDRLLDRKNFRDTIAKHFTEFEVKIESSTPEAYQRAFSCATAKRLKNVVYLFRAESEVPRLVESSDILYIGQTKYSVFGRYGRLADRIGGLHRNKQAVERYGTIRLSACNFRVFGRTLVEAENQLLWWYYQNHYEFPPFNYTKARNPKNLRRA